MHNSEAVAIIYDVVSVVFVYENWVGKIKTVPTSTKAIKLQ